VNLQRRFDTTCASGERQIPLKACLKSGSGSKKGKEGEKEEKALFALFALFAFFASLRAPMQEVDSVYASRHQVRSFESWSNDFTSLPASQTPPQ
jgi:hypothetical protein